jgi:hypothetical protein
MIEISDPQLQGTLAPAQWIRLLDFYHGKKGGFVFAGYEWLNARVWDNTLPEPLLQWALTAYGHCLGFIEPSTQQPPVITLHPAIWDKSHLSSDKGWAAQIPAGPRFTLDVVLHELIHVEVAYLRGGWMGGKSSHDNPKWCDAIERAAERLCGTMLEMQPFKALPTKRIRKDGHQLRRTPDRCLTMDECSRWPHSIREASCYGEQSVPMDWN